MTHMWMDHIFSLFSSKGWVPWLNFTRPPLCPKIKKRNIPEYSKKPGYSIFWQFWYVPCIFFGIFQNVLYPRFSEIGMSQNWKWNIPIFQVIPKKWSWVCPKYFLEYPIFQSSKTCVCPRFEMEYPGIFLEYSNLWADPKKI